MNVLRVLILVLLVCDGLYGQETESSSAERTARGSISFSRQIAPILRDHCVACHCAKKAEGGYRVDSYENLVTAGDSGETPIAVMKEDESEVLRRLLADASERMPAESDPLPGEWIEMFRVWMEEGARFDGDRPADLLAHVIPPATYAPPPEKYPRNLPITAAIFTPDGNEVVVSGYHEVTFWSLQEGKLVRRIGNIGQRIYSLAWSSDQNWLAVACGEPGRNGELRLVDRVSGNVTHVLARSMDVALDVAFRPKSSELAVAGADGTIRIVDFLKGSEVRLISSHADWVQAIAWNVDGSRLISGSRDKSAKVYDGTTGELIMSYQGHKGSVQGVGFLPDGKHAVSASDDQTLHRWEIDGGKRVTELQLGGEPYRLARGEQEIYVPCTNHQLRKFDVATSALTLDFVGHNDWVLTADVHLPTGRVVSASFDGEVRVWNAKDGTLYRAWKAIP